MGERNRCPSCGSLNISISIVSEEGDKEAYCRDCGWST